MMRSAEMRMITEAEAKAARLAPENVAAEIVSNGLAKQVEDVVMLGEQLFARAYLPSGESASFWLKVGKIAS